MRRFTVVFDGALDGKRLADFHINGATSVAYYDGDAYVCFQDFIAEIADLNAEITRLREALEKIANVSLWEEFECPKIARAALAEQGEK